jgi:hypothetical protein
MTKPRDLATLGGGFTQSGTGAIQRTVEDKLKDTVSVKDFGAVGDGTTNDTSAFSAMASALGYIFVPKGLFSLNTGNIDVPISFGDGGGITVPTGQVVTFRNRIEASSKQQIFYGSGTIYFLNDNALGIGEDSKHSYAAWWGIFPVGQVNTIQTALFNKALAAYTAQTREGIFELDCGSYRIDGTVTIPRGEWFKGASTRRTIIDLVGSGFTALEAGGSAVWISGIQFEQPAGDEDYFDGIQINLPFDTAKIEDVVIWNAKVGIKLGVAANLSAIENVRGIYGQQPIGGYPADSCTVLVQSDRNLISDIAVANTIYGPNAIVRFDASLGSVSTTTVDNIVTTENSILLDIAASSTFSVSEITVSNFAKSSGSVLLPIISMQTSDSANIRNISINGVVTTQWTDFILEAIQNSSGKTEGISIDSVTANYNTGVSGGTKLASLTNTSGTFNLVSFGNAISVGSTDPITTSGTITRLNVPNYLLPVITLANDTVGTFKPYTTGGQLLVFNNGNNGGFPAIASSGSILFDVGGSPTGSKVYGGANFILLATGTIPTGTTGTAGNVSVSVTNSGTIYIENRSGNSAEFKLTAL